MVGCVLVAEGRIIGEGWHRHYGGPHAEVQAVRDAEIRGFESLFHSATAYVTLEPCSHYGKTPPCAPCLLTKTSDGSWWLTTTPIRWWRGTDLTMLREAGIEVESGITG